MRKVIAWIARIIGFIASTFFLSLLVDEGLERFKYADPMVFKFIPWLLLALAGYITAWFKPALGGRISVLAGVLMFAFHVNRLDWFSAIVYGSPFILTGILFILSEPTSTRSSGHSRE